MYTLDENKLEWKFHFLGDEFEVNDEVVHQCNTVCANGFGGSENDWDEENKRQFAKSKIFGRLIDDNETIYGIAYYFTPDEKIFNSYVLWEAICLVNSVQGKGYAKKAVKEAIKLFPEREFRWLCCTTQNPSMFIRYSKLGGVFFPFNKSYNTTDGLLIMNFMLKHVVNLKELYMEKRLNLDTGVCKKLYPQGRLGNYPDNLDGAKKFEDSLQSWGFERELGDGIIIASEFRTKTL